eukprot:TRINITY_DN2188_c0_g1_i3.p1 TRINITY_DN2188_c0_g1~~TRINITY_DN2188_c0_g1_i3.p1  ORF type:complete len:330 (-),score=67.21 TRINITY_DN2188_c0_g1_i3:575-1564(-)
MTSRGADKVEASIQPAADAPPHLLTCIHEIDVLRSHSSVREAAKAGQQRFIVIADDGSSVAVKTLVAAVQPPPQPPSPSPLRAVPIPHEEALPSPGVGGHYSCDCGKVFATSQAKAGHCHFCSVHTSLRTPAKKRRRVSAETDVSVVPTDSPQEVPAIAEGPTAGSISNPHANEDDEEAFADWRDKKYVCECGKAFRTSQAKAGHCHFCPTHQADRASRHRSSTSPQQCASLGPLVASVAALTASAPSPVVGASAPRQSISDLQQRLSATERVYYQAYRDKASLQRENALLANKVTELNGVVSTLHKAQGQNVSLQAAPVPVVEPRPSK